MNVRGIQSIFNRYRGFILIIYLMFLLSLTLLNRSVGDEYRMELTPFWSYREVFFEDNKALIGQMVCNILVFVPWSILFALKFPFMRKIHWSVGSALFFSLFIEVVQLVSKCGLFEYDDVFHNTTGAIIGYVIWRGIVLWKGRRKGTSLKRGSNEQISP